MLQTCPAILQPSHGNSKMGLETQDEVCFFLTFRGRSTNRLERGGFFTNKNQTFQQREVFYLAKSKIPSSFGVWYHPVKSRWCFTSETCFLKKKALVDFRRNFRTFKKKNREVTHRILDDFFSWPVSLSIGWPKQRTPQVPQCSPRLMWTGQLILMEKAYFEFPTLHVPQKRLNREESS